MHAEAYPMLVLILGSVDDGRHVNYGRPARGSVMAG